MKKLILLLLLTIGTVSHAQDVREMLIGKWVFKDVLKKEKMSKAGLHQLRTMVIGKYVFEFRENGEFVNTIDGVGLIGSWKLDEKTNTIAIVVPEFNDLMKILKISPGRLELKLGLGEFLMEKG